MIDRGRIFLTTADEQTEIQSVLAFELQTGAPLWRRAVFKHGFDERAHKRNSQASSTIVCDGERVCASFLNDGGI